MKRLYFLMVLMMISIALTVGCKKEETDSKTHWNEFIANPEDYKGIIGISKIISHPALDAIEKGIIDELKDQGYVNLILDMQSANNEVGTAASIANKFKNENVLVAVGIATPMALSLANTMKDTPIVFAAVTDPIDAGLRKDNFKENTNITGVSDMTPVREQIELAAKIKPIKKLGFIYNAGEANSIVLLKLTEEACKDMGIEVVKSTVTNTSEVKQATEIVASKSDFIYASTDNVVYASLGSLVPTAAKYNVPVIAAVPDDDPNSGILASYGVDYYKAGREAGDIIIRILKGEKPGDIPVKYMTKPEELGLYINEKVAKQMGITVPEELLKQATPYAK